MTTRARRSFARAAACAGGLSALVVVNLTPTTSSFYYEQATIAADLEAGTWQSIPPACGDPRQYHDPEFVFGSAGSDPALPVDGSHPAPSEGGKPDPSLSNRSQIVFGLDGDDWLYGGNAKDCLIGGAGDDHLYGNNGTDVLIGGPGSDELHGDNSQDDLWGGDGGSLDLPEVLDGGKGKDDCIDDASTTQFISCDSDLAGSDGAAKQSTEDVKSEDQTSPLTERPELPNDPAPDSETLTEHAPQEAEPDLDEGAPDAAYEDGSEQDPATETSDAEDSVDALTDPGPLVSNEADTAQSSPAEVKED